MLPTASLAIFKLFVCTEELADGTSFLKADLSIQCYTPQYKGYATLAAFGIRRVPHRHPAATSCTRSASRDSKRPTKSSARPPSRGRATRLRLRSSTAAPSPPPAAPTIPEPAAADDGKWEFVFPLGFGKDRYVTLRVGKARRRP